MLHNLLAPTSSVSVLGLSKRRRVYYKVHYNDILPTWVEPARLGHLVSEFTVGAQLPGESSQAQNDGSENGGIGFPIRWLCVPATGW